MFATDILKVLYAPHKIFKEIIQNPKYLGPLLVFILVIAAQFGFVYAQQAKIQYEQTYPPFPDQMASWTTNTTLWKVSPGVTISNNTLDYLNSSFYGSSSLQFDSTNSSGVWMAIPSFNSVKCDPTAFQNLYLRTKQVAPLTTPNKITLTLYSLSDSNYYQYDLSSQFSNASLIGLWNNITVPVGPSATGWQSNGNPQWTNITGLKLEFDFASTSNVTIRMEGLFFGGFYQTAEQAIGTTQLVVYILQQVIFQDVFTWLFLAAVAYIIIKGLKGTVTWKPLFVAFGFILITSAITGLASGISTQTLPIVQSPIVYQAALPGEADAASNIIQTQTQTYTLIVSILEILNYVWIAALGSFLFRAVQPEFSWTKCILSSAAVVIAVYIILSILSSLGI